MLGAVVNTRLTVLSPSHVPVTVFRVAAGLVDETVISSRHGGRRASIRSKRYGIARFTDAAPDPCGASSTAR